MHQKKENDINSVAEGGLYDMYIFDQTHSISIAVAANGNGNANIDVSLSTHRQHHQQQFDP